MPGPKVGKARHLDGRRDGKPRAVGADQAYKDLMTLGGVLVEQVLPPQASSAAEARALVREALAAAAADDLAETAELVVSEVVTNSLVHAGTMVSVQVRVDDTGL